MANYELTIGKYSYNNSSKYYVSDPGDRIASVFDKIIEVAARKCDSYASDAFWDMYRLVEAANDETTFDRLLWFRETGVTSVDVKALTTLDYLTLKNIASQENIWRLSHKLELDEETGRPVWRNVFERVICRVSVSQQLNKYIF